LNFSFRYELFSAGEVMEEEETEVGIIFGREAIEGHNFPYILMLILKS
jgi:hypothetical protein